MVPTVDGWMVVAWLYTPGIYIARLDQDGSLISDPVIMGKNLDFEGGLPDVIAYRGGAAILGSSFSFHYAVKSGYAALFVSGNGSVQTWYATEGDQPIYGSFFEHQGRLFLIYVSNSTNKVPATNQVLIRELNCIH